MVGARSRRGNSLLAAPLDNGENRGGSLSWVGMGRPSKVDLAEAVGNSLAGRDELFPVGAAARNGENRAVGCYLTRRQAAETMAAAAAEAL